ncbi:Gp37-like protein [Saccharothrix australiensis]|uniref:Gp37-like protein n=1 Tax=Saccharothrix australiensis TaxID=2072 RepID=UPI00248296B7|nr:hypothetical protein [Saccharothrix australiensis]
MPRCSPDRCAGRNDRSTRPGTRYASPGGTTWSGCATAWCTPSPPRPPAVLDQRLRRAHRPLLGRAALLRQPQRRQRRVVAPRVPGLQIAADPVAGTTVTGRGRWQQLLPFLQDLAIAGGDIGFRVRQDGAALVFEVFRPRDLSSRIKLSTELGTLARYEYRFPSRPRTSSSWAAAERAPPAPSARPGRRVHRRRLAAHRAMGGPARHLRHRCARQEIRAQVLSEAGEVSWASPRSTWST